MAKCGMCMGRGSYDDPPWGIRVCVLCHGTGHDDPNVELWDRKGNVRHDAVERFGEARAQMQRIEQEHAAKSEFQREVEKLGASAATMAEPSDSWRQYAKDGETAQQCIERHRAEHDALLTLLAKAKSNECPLGCEEGICGYEKNGQASACPKESIRWKRERAAQQQAEPGADEAVTHRMNVARTVYAIHAQKQEPQPERRDWFNAGFKAGFADRAAQSGQRAGKPSDDLWNEKLILKIVEELNIMFASAQCEVDDSDGVTGYRIKTGALHRIVGALAGIGQSVSIPANMPVVGQRAGVAEWINAAVQDPPNDTAVLVSGFEYNNPRYARYYDVCRFTDGAWVSDVTGDSVFTPTHWMTIAAAPTQQQEGGKE